ncbi:aminoglycoside phosphotransferase family protein [Tropicimonas marinistellae]|uniref:aminoglycoside phosphotransferase family protein n=1 Tax=Tropicimonas marinistellae TaxID=1739787 RepID=UPI000835655E|nr:phosphotransferase [Tropicimonas marinistellae]
MTRAQARQELLDSTGWSCASSVPLVDDASSRRYERLTRTGSGDSVVLMDAPPDLGNDTAPFLRIAKHLSALGLSAPEVLAADQTAGYLLLEDLGDALFARLMDDDPTQESTLYLAATDLLLELHRHPAPEGLPPLGPEQMAEATDLALLWYATGCGRDATQEEVELCKEIVRDALVGLAAETPVLALRDFHAENLIWLPERTGPARVGLLDFQDAFAGPRAYDLISLLEDARRDVPPDIRAAMIAHYIERAGCDTAAFRTACAVLGAQRNLRILGIFARLSMQYGKPHYVAFIPRVWRLLQGDLAHPSLTRLSDFLADTLPEPTRDRLERIRRLCATYPTP